MDNTTVKKDYDLSVDVVLTFYGTEPGANLDEAKRSFIQKLQKLAPADLGAKAVSIDWCKQVVKRKTITDAEIPDFVTPPYVSHGQRRKQRKAAKEEVNA